ncbi:MAG: hypothetical protein ACTSP0_01580 [Alphaproteobacteria bacterium]
MRYLLTLFFAITAIGWTAQAIPLETVTPLSAHAAGQAACKVLPSYGNELLFALRSDQCHSSFRVAAVNVCKQGCKTRKNLCKSKCPKTFNGKDKACISKCVATAQACFAGCG